ncbi:MAG TPA: response regulator [Candidatus Hydrogenedentes bacterium]|nr:response regulator [Candidatus Hydrogenedentota bacterium]
MAKPKILIVDDEPDVVGLIERTLKVYGFDTLKAYDGIGALDLVSTEKPDLILLDIMMPMMSGYEVCEQIKANPQTQNIPVVCLSSAHTPDARAHSLRAGAVELITKPFMPAELVAQIRRYLRIESPVE